MISEQIFVFVELDITECNIRVGRAIFLVVGGGGAKMNGVKLDAVSGN